MRGSRTIRAKRNVLLLVLSLALPALPAGGCSPDESREHDAETGVEVDAPRDVDAETAVDGETGPEADAAGDEVTDGPADVAAETDVDFPPECLVDGDCPEPQGCYHGVCRHHCTLGTCLLAPGGGHCLEGFCVDCLGDSHCDGSRFVCDDYTHECVEGPVDPSRTKIGMFYNLWHCVVSADNPAGTPVHDISEVLAGRQSWGPIGEFHWWDEPQAGYYCLARNDPLLVRHATLLRDAGVDFVFLDVTNHAYVDGRSDRTRQMILEPLERLLAVWSTVERAPRVVPWVPLPQAGTDPAQYTVDALLQALGRYPGMQFEYLDRPLVLVTENEVHVTSEAKFAALSADYTLRRMWGVFRDDGPLWSFMQRCQEAPTSAALCDQRSAVLGGSLEQISIAAAYQETYMSLPSATPKHRGLTFRRQFETLLRNPDVPIATITGWNEWIAQRQPCDAHPSCPCTTYPSGCFIDQWDVEYSRDLEPGNNELGDYYYRLLVDCIALFRSGRMCGPATADNLCCREADV